VRYVHVRKIVLGAVVLAIAAAHTGPALAADPPAPAGDAPSGYVTREEYERLLRDQQSMRRELEALKREKATTTPTTGATDADIQHTIQAIRRDVRQLQEFRPGFDQLTISGDMSVGFSAQRHTNSTFSAGIAPLILWRPADKLLVEAGFDIGIGTDADSGESSTSFDLVIANISYELNDYTIIGGGLFVVPFGVFHNHFDPPWIDKLPDEPLPFGDGGIAPGSEVGIFAKGALPAGAMKFTYDVYLTNGPQLVTKDPDAAGSLNFDDFTDLNGNKAVGGRLGWIPIPEMEMGYSIQASEPNPSGFKRVHALLQAVDFNYKPELRSIKGVLDLRAEYVWSDVSRATYDPRGTLGFGPTRFGNYRQGGYVQVAYRPTLIDQRILRKFEVVGRYDWLTTPLGAPGGDHEHRYTIGLDYWLAPNAVLKAAYEFDHKKNGEDNSGFLAQFGLGL
jgi:hypothetical protein